MMKFLVLGAILALVFLVFFGRGRGKKPPEDASGGRSPREASKQAAGKDRQTMIACAHCGVHLPQDEAAFDAVGRPYCSAEHRLAGPR